MKSGGTPKSRSDLFYSNNGIPFLAIPDMKNKYLLKTDKHITNLAVEKTSTFIFEKDNLIYSIYATIGEISINKIDVALPQSILGIKANKSVIKNEYLYYLLKSNKNKILRLKQTGSQPNLSLEIFKNINLYLSLNLEEQEKIAKFFSLLDLQISLLENKLQLIEQKLKYFINKLLKTYNGFPKIRFKGFNDIWMNDYIKNIFTITRGLVIAKNKIIKESNEKFCYPVYSSQTENDGLMGYYNEYLYQNAITWTTDGAKAGTVNYRNQKFYCSNVCGVLLEKEYKPNLCFSLIIQRESKKYVVKDLGNPKLMNNIMAKIKIYFPNQIEEQDKISIFLNLFKIQKELIKDLIISIRKKKEYFLKNMFINSTQKGGDNNEAS